MKSTFSVVGVTLTDTGDCLIEGDATEGPMSVPFKHVNSFIKGVQRNLQFEIPKQDFGANFDPKNPIASLLIQAVGQSVSVQSTDAAFSGTIIGVHESKVHHATPDTVVSSQHELWLQTTDNQIKSVPISHQEGFSVKFNGPDQAFQARFNSTLANVKKQKDPDRTVDVLLEKSEKSRMHFRMHSDEVFARPKMTCMLNLDANKLSVFMTIYNMSPYNWNDSKGGGISVAIVPSMNDPIDVAFYPEDDAGTGSASNEPGAYYESMSLQKREDERSFAPKAAAMMAPRPKRKSQTTPPKPRPTIELKNVSLGTRKCAKQLFLDDAEIQHKREHVLELETPNGISFPSSATGKDMFAFGLVKESKPILMNGLITFIQSNGEPILLDAMVDRGLTSIPEFGKMDLVDPNTANHVSIYKLRKLKHVTGTLTRLENSPTFQSRYLFTAGYSPAQVKLEYTERRKYELAVSNKDKDKRLRVVINFDAEELGNVTVRKSRQPTEMLISDDRSATRVPSKKKQREDAQDNSTWEYNQFSKTIALDYVGKSTDQKFDIEADETRTESFDLSSESQVEALIRLCQILKNKTLESLIPRFKVIIVALKRLHGMAYENPLEIEIADSRQRRERLTSRINAVKAATGTMAQEIIKVASEITVKESGEEEVSAKTIGEIASEIMPNSVATWTRQLENLVEKEKAKN